MHRGAQLIATKKTRGRPALSAVVQRVLEVSLPAVTVAVALLLSLILPGARAQAPEGASPAPPPPQSSEQPNKKPAVFRVKYVGDKSIYIEAGHNADLQEGMKLSVVEPPDGFIVEGIQFRGYDHVAEVVVSSVSDSSAVCDVMKVNGELKVGQAAFLTPDSVTSRRQTEQAADAEKYPIVVAFTYGDPLDQEVRQEREAQETRQSPIQRLQGRIGFDYGGTKESGGFSSTQTGVVIDANMQNIGGTYWNFIGSWRGNMGRSNVNLPGTGTLTITDLVNRTYRIGLIYQNPYSPVTVGVGRLFVPWAPSLSTIDGAYLGRKIGTRTTVGFFGGSTPDPSSWSYNPNQHIAGSFVNVEYGGFDRLRVYSTLGVAVTSIQWKVARQFAFVENTWSWKQYVSFYNSLQADAARKSPLTTVSVSPTGQVVTVTGGSNPTTVSQSFSALHFQPIKLIGFGVNHNYFRTLPTYDPQLLGTGLLDRFLFQGFSGDVRLSLPKRISLYSSLGKSKTTTDKRAALNQAYGVTLGQIWKTGLVLDAHYTKFDSSFGSGKYQSLSLSKNLNDSFRIMVYGGHQTYKFAQATLSNNTTSNFVNGVIDWNVGSRYFLEGNYGWYQGTSLRYTQWSTVFGYRLGGVRK